MTGVYTTLRCNPGKLPKSSRTMLLQSIHRMLVAIPHTEVVRHDSTQLVHHRCQGEGLGQLPGVNESLQEVSHSQPPALTTPIATTDTPATSLQIVQKPHEDFLADFLHLPLPGCRVDQFATSTSREFLIDAICLSYDSFSSANSLS